MPCDYIFTGLGNPGGPYRGTRHNAGAVLVEGLSEKYRIPLSQSKYRSHVGRGDIAGKDCLLAIPQTYMNLSGLAVKRMLTYTGTLPSRLVVVHDDLDLPLGRIRLRAGGSAGGHRGVGSIIDSIQTGGFIRLKVGIGRPPPGRPTEDYVLGKFSRTESAPFAEALTRAAQAAETLVTEGIDKAMSTYN